MVFKEPEPICAGAITAAAIEAKKATVRFERDGQSEIHEEADVAIRDLELVIRQHKLASKN